MALTQPRRLGVHQAWNAQCAWCRRPVYFRDFEVEHLVPKSASPEELTRAIAEQGLREDFDVHASYNLAASCGSCNSRKGSNLPPRTPEVSLLFQRAEMLAPKIDALEQKFLKNQNLDEALAVIMAMQESGDLDREDLEQFEAVRSQIVEGVQNATVQAPYPPRLHRGDPHDIAPPDPVDVSERLDNDLAFKFLSQWVLKEQWALEVIAAAFDVEGQRLRAAQPVEILQFGGVAGEEGKFGARVRFNLDYHHIDDDGFAAEATTTDVFDLWLTIDLEAGAIVDATVATAGYFIFP